MMCFGLKDRKRLKTNHCVIVLLDDTQLVHELHVSSNQFRSSTSGPAQVACGGQYLRRLACLQASVCQ